MVFTGRATHEDGVFGANAEDVSDVISLISPAETPLLDVIGDSNRAAQSVYHEWMEDSLNPNTAVAKATVDDSGTALYALDTRDVALGGYLQIGAVMKNQTTGEYVQVSAAPSGNTLVLTRGFGGTTAATITENDKFFIVSEPALEGADVSADISRPRTRVGNYTQIFKKDVIVSGTQQSVVQLGGVADEFEYQKQQRLREALRDLEKTVIQGVLSGNSIGTSSAYRTMKGLWSFISTNATSLATLTPEGLNDVIGTAWSQGATDLDLIVVDANWKQTIDSWNITNVIVDNRPDGYVRKVTYFDSTYGRVEIQLNRWMPYRSAIVTATRRVKVAPLRGRSFYYKAVADTGDSMKGVILGEYTLEVMNEEGMAKAYAGS